MQFPTEIMLLQKAWCIMTGKVPYLILLRRIGGDYLYSGNISADLAQLEQLCRKIKLEAEAVDAVREKLVSELNELCGMGLNDIEYWLEQSAKAAEKIDDELLTRAKTLEKVTELYRLTEVEQAVFVSRLPDKDIFNSVKSGNTYANIENISYINNRRVFSSNYIINEDWLNDISFEWREQYDNREDRLGRTGAAGG